MVSMSGSVKTDARRSARRGRGRHRRHATRALAMHAGPLPSMNAGHKSAQAHMMPMFTSNDLSSSQPTFPSKLWRNPYAKLSKIAMFQARSIDFIMFGERAAATIPAIQALWRKGYPGVAEQHGHTGSGRSTDQSPPMKRPITFPLLRTFTSNSHKQGSGRSRM